MQEVRNETPELVNAVEEVKVPRFTPYSKAYGVNDKGELMMDASGQKPKVFTIKYVAESIMGIFQGSVPFMTDGIAIAKIGTYWYKCRLVPIEEYHAATLEKC